MASITPIKTKKGVRFRAQIRITRAGAVVYNETATWDTRALARDWAALREAELRVPGALERAAAGRVSLAQVLRWYRDDFDGATKFGASKLSHVNFLIEYPVFCDLDALTLTTEQLVRHAKRRIEVDGVKPATVNNDFVWLSNAFKDVRLLRGIELDRSIVEDAMYLCRKMSLISRSGSRDRRPTIAELDALLEYFDGSTGSINMVDIILFAVFSARRLGEICRIEWRDLDVARKRVLVRQMKHPRKKIDTWVFLPERAMAIIERQRREGDCIFAFNSKSVGSAFLRACRVLAIDDLRLHDLRHEGASHLFELGWAINDVAGVTGHRAWATLQRYTHIYELGKFDKYAGWRWIL